MGLNDGVLTISVWPTYVGVKDEFGNEPWHYADYHRSQILWEMIDGHLQGRSLNIIYVPGGQYNSMVLTHHPTSPLEVASPAFDHGLHYFTPAEVEINGIVEADFALVTG